MTIDDKIRDKNCNRRITEKLQKYQHYLEKQTEDLTDEEILSSDQSRMIE